MSSCLSCCYGGEWRRAATGLHSAWLRAVKTAVVILLLCAVSIVTSHKLAWRSEHRIMYVLFSDGAAHANIEHAHLCTADPTSSQVDAV